MIACSVELKKGGATAVALPKIGRLASGQKWTGELSRGLFQEYRKRRNLTVVDLRKPPAQESSEVDTTATACTVTFPKGHGFGRLVPGIGKMLPGEAWEGELPLHLVLEYASPRHDLQVSSPLLDEMKKTKVKRDAAAKKAAGAASKAPKTQE